MIDLRAPVKTSAAYRAAEHIYKNGLIKPHDLFALIHFGNRLSARTASLERSMGTGFLCEIGGLVGITEFARAHFDALEPEDAPKPKGQVVQPRQVDVMNRPPISKKYIPNSRGFRDDQPAWSMRGK